MQSPDRNDYAAEVRTKHRVRRHRRHRESHHSFWHHGWPRNLRRVERLQRPFNLSHFFLPNPQGQLAGRKRNVELSNRNRDPPPKLVRARKLLFPRPALKKAFALQASAANKRSAANAFLERNASRILRSAGPGRISSTHTQFI